MTLFCDNPSSPLFYHSIANFFFNNNIFWAICHFHERAIARRRKAWFHLRMSRILFVAKHSWTALSMSRPLFVGSFLQVTLWALSKWKGRKIALNNNYLWLQRNSRNLVNGCFLHFEFIHLCWVSTLRLFSWLGKHGNCSILQAGLWGKWFYGKCVLVFKSCQWSNVRHFLNSFRFDASNFMFNPFTL